MWRGNWVKFSGYVREANAEAVDGGCPGRVSFDRLFAGEICFVG